MICLAKTFIINDFIMTYAIVEIGGKQIWVKVGRFYDVNKLKALPGETVSLNKVLLLKKDGEVVIGSPCIERCVVKARVLRHLKGKKKVVFKMKKKKNMRSKRGHRQYLTRLLIQEI